MSDGVCSDHHPELEGKPMTRGCRACHIADLEHDLEAERTRRQEAEAHAAELTDQIASERDALRERLAVVEVDLFAAHERERDLVLIAERAEAALASDERQIENLQSVSIRKDAIIIKLEAALAKAREELGHLNHTALCLTWMASPCNCGLDIARAALADTDPSRP